MQLRSRLLEGSGPNSSKEFPPQTMQKQVHGLFPQYQGGYPINPHLRAREGTLQALRLGKQGCLVMR